MLKIKFRVIVNITSF